MARAKRQCAEKNKQKSLPFGWSVFGNAGSTAGVESEKAYDCRMPCGEKRRRSRGRKMRLYHTSNVEIREPDIRRGRKNADFGQGFYLTPDLDFAQRWAGPDMVVNEYELDEDGLQIHRFCRDEAWFDYIFHNRRVVDGLAADVVIGPIANDTIFDTFGIISSGFLETADAMKLLMIGPEYTQVAIKSEKAVSQLRWLRAEKIERLDAGLQKTEQDEYAAVFAKVMQEITGDEE